MGPVNHVAASALCDILSYGGRGLPRGGQFSRWAEGRVPTEEEEESSEGRIPVKGSRGEGSCASRTRGEGV